MTENEQIKKMIFALANIVLLTSNPPPENKEIVMGFHKQLNSLAGFEDD